MKNNTVKILLIISFAFNIAFLGGGIFRSIKFRKQPPIHKRVNNEKVREFMERRKEIGHPLMQDFHKSKNKFMKALTKPEINEAEMQILIDELIEKQVIMEQEIGRSMIELRQQLSDTEAKEVFGKFQRWMQPPEGEHSPEGKHPKPRRRPKKNN